jgi:hypothetical protein
MIGTKWGIKNKQRVGEVVRNKAHLVTQGFSQVEGLDFGEIFAHVTHLKAIMILLAFTAFKGFKLYQMNVKSTFLNSVIRRKCLLGSLQVSRTPSIPIEYTSFQRFLYGLKQASWAWYVRLKTFLLEHEYVMGSVDKSIFTLKYDNDFLLVQIYVDDINFGGSSHALVSSFQKMMEKEIHMSMMGELNFFLGIQVKQTK